MSAVIVDGKACAKALHEEIAGGVYHITIAMLLSNTLLSARKRFETRT